MDLTSLSPQVSVTPQLLPQEVAQLAKAGFKGIINNRPDDEAPNQPRSSEIEAEARRHGLVYRHIPIIPGKATEADVKAFAAAVRDAGGPVVAFCRTGNRSTQLFTAAKLG
ncbi:MAG: TIGR01244 family sulfur transferase [Pseudomonadota bacterium]